MEMDRKDNKLNFIVCPFEASGEENTKKRKERLKTYFF